MSEHKKTSLSVLSWRSDKFGENESFFCAECVCVSWGTGTSKLTTKPESSHLKTVLAVKEGRPTKVDEACT